MNEDKLQLSHSSNYHKFQIIKPKWLRSGCVPHFQNNFSPLGFHVEWNWREKNRIATENETSLPCIFSWATANFVISPIPPHCTRVWLAGVTQAFLMSNCPLSHHHSACSKGQRLALYWLSQQRSCLLVNVVDLSASWPGHIPFLIPCSASAAAHPFKVGSYWVFYFHLKVTLLVVSWQIKVSCS